MNEDDEDDIKLYITKSNSDSGGNKNNNKKIKVEVDMEVENDDDYIPPRDIDEGDTEIHSTLIDEDEDDYVPPKDMDSLDPDNEDFQIDNTDFFFDDGTTNNNNTTTTTTTTTTTSTSYKRNNYRQYKRNNYTKGDGGNYVTTEGGDKFDKRLSNLKKTGKDEAKKRGYTPKKGTVAKIAPSFKIVTNSKFLVDGFQYKSEEYKDYFLTHFHSDHYTGITKTWSFGNIYCTEETGKLIALKLGVEEKYIKKCPWNELIDIGGVKVAFLDANHCPGSALILFIQTIKKRNEDGSIEDYEESILHTGDFRYNSTMNNYPLLKGRIIDKLYLDNTFCDPQFIFPPQFEIIKQVASIVKKENNGTTLFLFGTYVIGKEKILIEIARQENKPIHVSNEKYKILSCLTTCLDINKFTTNESITPFRAVAMTMLGYDNMISLLDNSNGKYKKVIAFRPTGWTQAKKSITYSNRGPTTFYSVAYSEHSSYNELRSCIDSFRPKEIIPTVDCNSQYKVDNILSHFSDLYTKKKQNTIASFFSAAPVVNLIQSFFKSKTEPTLSITTNSNTNTTISTTTTANNNNSPKFNDDLIDWDCSDDVLLNNQLVKQSSLDAIVVKKDDTCTNNNNYDDNDDLIILTPPLALPSTNNNNNNNSSSSTSFGLNIDDSLPIDLDDPVFINQQRVIEEQIYKSQSLSKTTSSSGYKTTIKSNNSNSSVLGKNKSPSSTPKDNNKKPKLNTTPPSSAKKNSLSAPPPPSQSLITSFFQKNASSSTPSSSLFDDLSPPSKKTTTTTSTAATSSKSKVISPSSKKK